MLMYTLPSPFAMFTMIGEITEEGTMLEVVAKNVFKI